LIGDKAFEMEFSKMAGIFPGSPNGQMVHRLPNPKIQKIPCFSSLHIVNVTLYLEERNGFKIQTIC
jgi:hypothetical protein